MAVSSELVKCQAYLSEIPDVARSSDDLISLKATAPIRKKERSYAAHKSSNGIFSFYYQRKNEFVFLE
jgi:hypothetical protein